MILELIAQSVPSMGAMIGAGLVVILLLAAYFDPELVEVYLGETQLIATLALAVGVLIFVAAGPSNATHQDSVSAVLATTR